MGFLNTLFGKNTPQDSLAVSQLAQEHYRLQDDYAFLDLKYEETSELAESLLRISDSFDNARFAPLEADESNTMSLKMVKRMSELCRSITAVNPFVKRGVRARLSYVWGKGVQFDKIEKIEAEQQRNYAKMFSSQAYEELEIAAATDGNVFRAVPIDNEYTVDNLSTTLRVPLNQITDAVSNPDDFEDVWFYKRTWSVTRTDSRTGDKSKSEKTVYYISMPYYLRLKELDRPIPSTWKKVAVDQNFVMQHIAVNRQIGWRWGIPDVAAVVFWANAYKEYLENNADLVKAYSRLAWNVKAQTQSGAQAAAAQVMSPPSRDPFTGRLNEVGGTSIGGGGVEFTPTSVNSSQVDFSKGRPLASAIAAGLEVSLVVITSDAGTANRSGAESLDLPTLKAMEARQLLWSEAYMEVFKFWGVQEAIITWPQIYNDSTKDRIAALGTLDELKLLYPEESRKEALDVMGIAAEHPWNELPDPADDVRVQYEEKKAEQAFENAQKQAEATASVVPGQGKSGGVSAKGGAMSDSNSARDNRGKDSNKS